MYALHRETFYLAQDFFDRFMLTQKNINKSMLQLIGITSLFIASKLEVSSTVIGKRDYHGITKKVVVMYLFLLSEPLELSVHAILKVRRGNLSLRLCVCEPLGGWSLPSLSAVGRRPPKLQSNANF